MTDQTTQHNQRIVEQFSWQAIPFSALPGHAASIDMLIGLSGVGVLDAVLDVACGPGLVACEFARHARHVTGIDITPKMIKTAEDLQAKEGLSNLTWHVGDVLPLPFATNTFDVVLTRYSFHHFIDPMAVLREMVRVCKPGGRVIVADVAMPSNKVDAYNRLEKLRDPSHVRALEISELTNMISSAGLQNVRIGKYKVDGEVEQQLQASFPHPGDEDQIREIFRRDLTEDNLGINVRSEDGKVCYSVPILVVVAVKPE